MPARCTPPTCSTWWKTTGAKNKHLFVVDFDDDILPGCIITHGGEVVNETIKKILEGGA